MYAFTVFMRFHEVSVPQQRGKITLYFYISSAKKHIHLSFSMLINMTIPSMANYV